MAELRAQIAELTLEKAAYADRARCTASVAQRSAHHATCPATRTCHARSAHQHLPRSPSTAVMPASPAGSGGESATCTCQVAIRWKTTDSIHLSVPHAQRRCAASLGALSAQYSNLVAADSKPKAAQCGASDAPLRDGSGSQSHSCTRTCECAPVGALDVRA